MRIYLLSLLSLAALAVSGCQSVECGDGTIERAGTCVRADETFSAAKCGAFTVLVGGVCKPMFDPTVCDGATTLADVDPATGVTTCIGTGTGGCGAPIACPAPSTGKQTICGQLYNFETDQTFAATGATGARCQAGATAGPCALGIRAYDAVMFGMNPSTATPLTVADTYIDDCGRYRLTDVTLPASPFIGLGIDDAMAGPAGVTNSTGVATAAAAGAATRNLEAFIAPKSTTDLWTASGGPSISGGIYAMVFRANSTGRNNRSGIAVSKNNMPAPAVDYYFTAAQTTRATVDAAATTTGANGTGLITGAGLGDGTMAYNGTGLPTECSYPGFPGVSLPFILFVQVLRPINASGATCPL